MIARPELRCRVQTALARSMSIAVVGLNLDAVPLHQFRLIAGDFNGASAESTG